MTKKDFEDDSIIKGNIEIAFSRLIGPLSIMSVMDSYKESRLEIKKILKIVINWGAEFQIKQHLLFINKDELLDVYERIECLKDKYLFDASLGYENELSDEIVIWIWEIMELRKSLIERNK